MKNLITYLSPPAFALVSILTLAGCTDINSPYSDPYGGYGDPYYGSNDDYYRRREWERTRRERHELERERDRIDAERRRLEDERRDTYRSPPPPPVPRVQERCPAGFSPSERKCTNEERRHGCKDMRLPGGLGCVHR
jgi:hypothetical protein